MNLLQKPNKYLMGLQRRGTSNFGIETNWIYPQNCITHKTDAMIAYEVFIGHKTLEATCSHFALMQVWMQNIHNTKFQQNTMA